MGVLAVVAVLAAMLTGTLAAPAPAEAATSGTGGQFVATSGRIMSAVSVAANTWTTVQVAGQAGIPSDGSAGSVVVNATVSNMPGQGQLSGRPDSSTAATLITTYDGDGKGNTSGTATLERDMRDVLRRTSADQRTQPPRSPDAN